MKIALSISGWAKPLGMPGLAMLMAVPLYLLSIKLYLILTWIGLLLFLLGLKKKRGDGMIYGVLL